METVTNPLTPDEIDLAFVGRTVPDLDIATVGDEQIVMGGATQLVVLNPTAALILQFLDGEATLGELVNDFADVLGVDRAVVEQDVVGFARELGANGLLDGVALAEPELPEGFIELVALEPLEVGDELEDFTLSDLEGGERSLSESRGKRVLLVNWSAGCGFCVKIVAELAALHPLLIEHDVDLLFVALGDADSNRALFESVGLTAPLLLQDFTVDPFRGTGTPAAYLLDEHGRLAETMVVGANQVPALVRDLAGVDPATPYGVADVAAPDDGDLVEDGPRGNYLPAPGAMCGPGGGESGSNTTDWIGTRAYALGDYHVGVRYDAPETADVLDRLFPGARVNDRRVPDNYSVALGDAAATKEPRVARSLKLLVHGSTQLVRSRSAGRVLAGLVAHLSADLDGTSGDSSLTRVRELALVRDGEAVLFPSAFVDSLKQLQPRLARAGIAIVDTPSTLLDLASAELMVPELTVAHDPAVIAELDDAAQLGSELPRVRPGRYPLCAWFVLRAPGLISPAMAVAATVGSVHDLDDLAGTVARLGELFMTVEPHGVWYQSVEEIVDQVVTALD